MIRQPSNELKGLRYINWARCSTGGQTETSIPDQINMLNGFGTHHQMTHVGDMILEGVSGLSPVGYEKVQELVARKQERNDFDVLLIHDFSRLTRRGPIDGGRIIADLRDVGVRVISINDDIPNDEFGEVYQTFKHFAANQQSRAISLAVTRGSMSALMKGRRGHSQTANYGLDRRIIGPDGEPRFLLRLNEDGSQDKLTLDGQTVLETFAPNPKKGPPNHYKLQKNEDFDYVLGKPERVEVVNRIYRRHHLDNWGAHRIAKELNGEGIPSPQGKRWSAETVQRILMNPVYLGVGISNLEATGRYFIRSEDGPTPANRSPEELARYKQMPRRLRPEKDWRKIDQPEVREFLDHYIRELAAAEQAEHYRRLASGTKAKRRRDRHVNSPFLLKHRMFESTTGRPMVGHTSRRGDKSWRSYKTSGAYRPGSDPNIPTKMIPADPADQMAVGLLGVVIRMAPDLRDVLRRQIIAQQEMKRNDGRRLDELTTKLSELKRQIAWIMDNVCQIGEDEANIKLAALAEQRDRIDRQIGAINDGAVLSEAETDALVDILIEQIGKIQNLVRQTGMPAVHRLLDVLLVKAVADVERKWIDFEFRLPPWALKNPEALCLASGHDYTTWREAGADHAEDGLLLMRFKAFPYGKGRWLAFG